MAIHGKIGRVIRNAQISATEKMFRSLLKQIHALPLKDGRIVCQIGHPKYGSIQFFIDQKTVLAAAEAGVKFAQEKQDKGPTIQEAKSEINQAMEMMIEHGRTETDPQSSGR